MANDIPHVPDAREPGTPATSVVDSYSQPAAVTATLVQTPPANAVPNHPGAPNATVQTPPAPELPPPSGSNAFWLGLTLLNIVLIVFLLPASVLKNEQVAFMIRVGTLVAAAGAFAAGLVWFKNLLSSLPTRKLFKRLNIAVLCLLIPIHVSQLPVVAVYPRIEPKGVKLEIDGRARDYETGTIRLSINNHPVQVSPVSGGKPRDFNVTYKDVFFALFSDYRPRWTPLFQVTIDTNSENVEVTIQKKDGEFDAAFRKSPPATELNLTFEPRADARDVFIYRGANNPIGSADHVELPYGDYEFTARKKNCADNDVKSLKVGSAPSERYIVDFKPLCETDQ